MGGKSRKSGGVSKKLIDALKKDSKQSFTFLKLGEENEPIKDKGLGLFFGPSPKKRNTT